MPRVNSSRRGLAGSIAGLKRSGNCAPTSLASGGLERIPAPRPGDASRKGERAVWGTSAPDIAGSSSTGGSRFSGRASRAVYPVRARGLRRAGSTRMAGRRSPGTGGQPTSGQQSQHGRPRQPEFRLRARPLGSRDSALRAASPTSSVAHLERNVPDSRLRVLARVVHGAGVDAVRRAG